MCFYMPLLQCCLGVTPFGARSSGPDSCGIGTPKSVWLHHHRSHSCASTCLCYKVAWGHSVRGPKFGARLLWYRYAKKTFDYIIIVHIHVLLPAFATKLPGGTLFRARSSGPEVRGPKFGARLLWHRYAKKHLITYSEFTYMCFYVHVFATKLPGGTLFGAWSSGPDSCGIGME